MIEPMTVTRQTSFDTPGGNTTTPLATPSTGARQVMVVRQEQEPGGANPSHRKSTESLVVVLAGDLEVVLPDGEARLAVGDAILVPPSTLHHVRNAGPDPARWLVVSPADVAFEREDGEPVVPIWAH